MFICNIFILAGLASTALATADEIINAMGTISNITADLDATVSSWDGGLFGTPAIVVKSTELLIDIKKGTEVAKASANLTIAESIQVALATSDLATVTNSTLTTIINAKPKFDKLLLTPAIYINLELEKDAVEDFSSAVLAKVPDALQDTAKSLVEPITEAFDKAIAEYSLFKEKRALHY